MLKDGRRADKVREATTRRASARDSYFLSATIRKAGAAPDEVLPLRVRNLSEVGLMADFIDVAKPGEAVVVSVRGIGSVPGKVAWVRRGQIGITFDVEVDPKAARKPVGAQRKSLLQPL